MRPIALLFSAQFSLSHACFILTYSLAGVLGAMRGLAPTALVLAVIVVIAGIIAMWSWKAPEELRTPEVDGSLMWQTKSATTDTAVRRLPANARMTLRESPTQRSSYGSDRLMLWNRSIRFRRGWRTLAFQICLRATRYRHFP